MFGGSENVRELRRPAREPPARPAPTARPGTTAPTTSRPCRRGALDLALFMESDRMGHLLGAVTQDKLDKQRGVVQNEKRQGDNQPYGLVDYKLGDALFPVGHPYRHSTIGSMADLDAASLDRRAPVVHRQLRPEQRRAGARRRHRRRDRAARWSRRWFGDIPRGPEVAPGRRRAGHARRAGARGDGRPGAGHPHLPRLDRPGADRPRRGGARARHACARRARQLAARQRAGARRAARGARSPPAPSSTSRSASCRRRWT